MRRRAYALLTIAAIVLPGHAASSSINAQTPAASRIDAISALANAAYNEWLGPSASPALALAGESFDRAGSMALESEVAFRLARERFTHVDAGVADGIALFLQSRVVEQAFNQQYRSPGYRHYSTCVFDCQFPVVLPALTLSRWADGIGRIEFLRQASARDWPARDRRFDAIDGNAYGIAIALASLERELGWPALQGALQVVAQNREQRDALATLETATGRSLAPVFEAAAGGSSDFLIRSVSESATDECAPPECHLTEVAIAGDDTLPFPLTLRIEFADDTFATAAWTGSKEAITFQSAAPYARIQLDPERKWLLDADYSNNDHLRVRTTNVPVTKWLARWMVWLQDATLTYTFFA